MLTLCIVPVDDGESADVTLFQCRAKLYVLQSKDDGWKIRGDGKLKVNVPMSSVSLDSNGKVIPSTFDGSKMGDKDSSSTSSRVARLIMRQENTYRVILNTIILSGTEFLDSNATTSRAWASTAHILFTGFEGEKEARPISMLLKVKVSAVPWTSFADSYKMSGFNSRLFRDQVTFIQYKLREAERARLFPRKTQPAHTLVCLRDPLTKESL